MGTVRSMNQPDAAGTLTPQELAAVASAAAWYAKYHSRIIADRADDSSAYAVAQRERYAELVAGLEKLGVWVGKGARANTLSRAA